GKVNTTGSYNYFSGIYAGHANTTAFYNQFIGNFAGQFNTTGLANHFCGYLSGYSNSTGSYNCFNGFETGYWNTTGSNNVAVGERAMQENVDGSENITIGYQADLTGYSLTNATAIGANSLVNASNKVMIGNTNVTSIGGYANWSNFSDGRFKRNVSENVPGIAFIEKLRPVTYTLDIEAINAFNTKDMRPDSIVLTVNPDKKNEVYSGFIAQEVEQAANSLQYNFSGVDKPHDADKQTYALRYSDFVVPLVKAIQEQQAEIDALLQRIAVLEQKSNQ
ncbi:MAG TPA: tail fiber domain-containing protein, partial [Saprospiraceae bacterium]|nr:tail fiber domain-containing protein [Saprospiraceae bacterium]